jgi:hypothetical protein
MQAAGVRLATLLNAAFANFEQTKVLPMHFQESLKFIKRQASASK